MNNYHYIVAFLPVLVKGTENKSFSLANTKAQIKAQCSDKDNRLIDLLCRIFDGSKLDINFYKDASKSASRFIRLYSKLDLQIRNFNVASAANRIYSQDKANELISKYQVIAEDNLYGDYIEPTDWETELQSADIQLLHSIFAEEDIVAKEKKLDEFKWNKITDFSVSDFFNIDEILAFLAKGYIVDRWLKLDAEKGKHLFRKLVNEIRGTFDKNKLIYTIDENNG